MASTSDRSRHCPGHYDDDATLLSGIAIGMPTYCDGTCSAGQEADAKGNPPVLNVARALLTDAEGHVVRTMVFAPAEVESWSPDTPVTVSWPSLATGIQTVAGCLALYEAQIGWEPTERLEPGESWQPNCAYCDHYLLLGSVEYPVYDGQDPDGGICRAHPRTDRPRPHLPKWRVWNDTTTLTIINDPANPEGTRKLRARERRIAELFPAHTPRRLGEPTSSSESNKDQAAREIVHMYETVTERGYDRYGLIRYYHRAAVDKVDVFRVTVRRNDVDHLCSARTEILSTSRTWTEIVHDPGGNWGSTTSPLTGKAAGGHPEPGLVTLGRVADELARTAMTIVPA
jgi:hypothetical protein